MLRSKLAPVCVLFLTLACSDGSTPGEGASLGATGGQGAFGSGGDGAGPASGGAATGGSNSGTAGGVGASTNSGGATGAAGGSSSASGGGVGDGSGGAAPGGGGESTGPGWLPSWATSIQGYESEKTDHVPPIALPNNTLRQFIYPTFDGDEVRVQISNEKGADPLDLKQVHLAKPTGNGAIDTATDVALTFNGMGAVTIPAGTTAWSDGVSFSVKRAQQTAISIQFGAQVPAEYTTHPGSRSTSYFATGDAVSKNSLGNQTRDRWYFISGLDVMASEDTAAIAILGDSITDGYGILNEFKRWPDALTLAIGSDATLKDKVSVLNFGMGANTITEPQGDQDAGKDRFKRDILTRDKVKWLIIFEGVNDINYVDNITAGEIIDAYEEVIAAAHAKGMLVYMSPITPMGSSSAIRDEVNAWIRANGAQGGVFDGIIDFDELIRDPNNPEAILSMYNNDGLHPNAAGYTAMGNAVDLNLFK